MTLSAQHIIDTMAGLPVEAQPIWWLDIRNELLDESGDTIAAIQYAVQACIGSMIEWLDAWCEKHPGAYRESATPAFYAQHKEFTDHVCRPRGQIVTGGRGPARFGSLAALIRQLAEVKP